MSWTGRLAVAVFDDDIPGPPQSIMSVSLSPERGKVEA